MLSPLKKYKIVAQMEKLYYESDYRNILHRTYLLQEKQTEFPQMVLLFGGGGGG